MLAKTFLIMRGFHFEAPYNTAVEFIVSIANDDKTISQIRKWLENNSKKSEEKDLKSYLSWAIEDLKEAQI